MVVPNSLFITVIKLLQGLIELTVNIAELIEGIVVANSSLTTSNKSFLLGATIAQVTSYSNIIYNNYTNHFLTSPPQNTSINYFISFINITAIANNKPYINYYNSFYNSYAN